jgi:hypothetical protein
MFFYFKIINCLIISLVPTHETVRTKAWYRPYHGMKLTVPKGGTVRTNAWYFFILPTFFRVQRNKGNIKEV